MVSLIHVDENVIFKVNVSATVMYNELLSTVFVVKDLYLFYSRSNSPPAFS